MTTLTATAVRVGMRVLLIPTGQPIPEGAVVYGGAAASLVYQTYYEATHCRKGHRRARWQRMYRRSGGGWKQPQCLACGMTDPKPSEWTWGRPS